MTRLRMFDGLSGLPRDLGRPSPWFDRQGTPEKRQLPLERCQQSAPSSAVLSFCGQPLAFRLLDDTDRGEVVQQVLDFKAEKLTDAAACGGREDHEHPVFWTLDPGKLCHGFRCDRWSPLLRSFYERKVQFVCIPFLRIEWVAVRIFSRCNDRSCHAKVGIDRLR